MLAITSLCSSSSEYAIFSPWLVQIDPDILMKVTEGYSFILYFGSLAFLKFSFKVKTKFSSLDPYWKLFLHLLSWGNMKLTKKCRFKPGNFKYNKNKKAEVKSKTVDSTFFGIFCNTDFSRHQVLLNFQEKQAVRRILSWSSKNHPHKYVQHQVLYVTASTISTICNVTANIQICFMYFPFYIISN